MLTGCVLVLRDVRERGRDIEGIIKQWFDFVKPSYTKYVEPQRRISGENCMLKLETSTSNHFPDIIIPRGIENKTAIGKVRCKFYITP